MIFSIQDLSELKPYTFRGLKKLRMLSIENSDLATIRKHAFHGKIFKITFTIK
jgi:hypothetical protein